MFELWKEFDRLRAARGVDFKMPWDSDDPEVIELWTKITDPQNIEVLREELKGNLNKPARKVRTEALDTAIFRKISQEKKNA